MSPARRAIKAFVAVTDNDWFRFLSLRPDLDEVNFWTPSGKRLANMSLGQPVLFKLHAPESKIVGGGFFAHFSRLPVSLAWGTFGEMNGVETYREMRSRIEKYLKVTPDPREDYEVGCEILEEPFFLPRDRWFPPPEDFSPNVQRVKGYDLASPIGRTLWERVTGELALSKHRMREGDFRSPYGEPRLSGRDWDRVRSEFW